MKISKLHEVLNIFQPPPSTPSPSVQHNILTQKVHSDGVCVELTGTRF